MSGAPASEKPTLVGNDIVQQIKDGPPKAAGGDGDESKMIARRPGKSRRRTRKVRNSIVGPSIADVKLPALQELIPSLRDDIFRQKLELCCTTFDYYDTESYVRDKTIKQRTLEELISYTRPDSDVIFSDETIKLMVNTMKINLFRSPELPLTYEEEMFGIADEDENILELIWQHTQPIYQLFLNFVVHKNLDTNLAKRQLTLDFISRFTELFDRDDAREREYVKTLLHRMYGRFLSYRSMIRRMMAHKFFEVTYESRCNRGVAEMLEFLGSIINGFATPLKGEHVRFLEAALIPLLKSSFLPAFLLELMYCITQFVEKDPNTSIAVVRGLRRYWPVTNSAKQLMYLQLLEEILNLVAESDADVLRLLYDPMCEILALGFACPAFAILERTCELWTSQFLCEKLLLHRDCAFEEILPRIYRPLSLAQQNTWSSPAQFLTKKVLSMYEDLDGAKYADVVQKELVLITEDRIQREVVSQKWTELLHLHALLPLQEQYSSDDR